MSRALRYPKLSQVSLIYYFEHGIINDNEPTIKETHMLLKDGTTKCVYDMPHYKYRRYREASRRLFIKKYVVKNFKRECIAKYLPNVSDVSSVRYYFRDDPSCSTGVCTYFYLYDGTILFILGMAIEEYIVYWDKISFYFREQLRIKYTLIANYVQNTDATKEIEWKTEKDEELVNSNYPTVTINFVDQNYKQIYPVYDQTLSSYDCAPSGHGQSLPSYVRSLFNNDQTMPKLNQEAIEHNNALTYFVMRETNDGEKIIVDKIKSVEAFYAWCINIHGCHMIDSSIETLKEEVDGIYVVRTNKINTFKLCRKLSLSYNEWTQQYNECAPYIEEIYTYELVPSSK